MVEENGVFGMKIVTNSMRSLARDIDYLADLLQRQKLNPKKYGDEKHMRAEMEAKKAILKSMASAILSKGVSF